MKLIVFFFGWLVISHLKEDLGSKKVLRSIGGLLHGDGIRSGCLERPQIDPVGVPLKFNDRRC